MSGIYIKGMEMPKYCSACYCNSYHWCNLLDRSTTELLMTGRRFDDCPLIHVPDHGRLIDADEFERRCMFDPEIEDMQDVIYALRDYPSIIPATKEGEG